MSWRIIINNDYCPYLLNGHECRYLKEGENSEVQKECSKERCPIRVTRFTGRKKEFNGKRLK